MKAKKIVAGSVAGAALAWSAGAHADSYYDGYSEGAAYIMAEVHLWCDVYEGVGPYWAWAQCVGTHLWFAGNEVQASVSGTLSWCGSGCPYEYGMFIAGEEAIAASAYYYWSGGS